MCRESHSRGQAEAVVLLLGRQGAGKGLIGRLLATHVRGDFLSMGDVLRTEQAHATHLGLEIGRLIDAGHAVTPAVSYGLMANALAARPTPGPLVLDGIPRRVSEVERVTELLGREPSAVIVLDVPVPIAVERLLNRQSCQGCGMPHGPAWPARNGRCRSCEKALSPRPDDSDVVKISHRLEVWGMESRAICGYYDRLGVLHEVIADGHVNEVLERVIAAFARFAA